MERLFSQLNKIKDDDIYSFAEKNYDSEQFSTGDMFLYYKEGIENLKGVGPKMSHDIIFSIMKEEFEIDELKDEYLQTSWYADVFILKGQYEKMSFDDMLDNCYALDLSSWDELLGSYIVLDEESNPAEMLLYIIRELLFFGNSYEENEVTKDEQLKVLDESIQSVETNAVTFEEFLDELLENIDEEQAAEIARHYQFVDEHNDEINAFSHEVFNRNNDKVIMYFQKYIDNYKHYN